MSTLISIILLAGGVFFLAVGVLGLIRLPDAFSRMHATAKSDTLGAGLVLAACAVHYGWTSAALEILVVIVFVLLSTPVATHLIAQAAYRSGGRDDRGN